MSGNLDWGRNSGLKFGKYMQYCLELHLCKVRHMAIYLYGFEKDMSERSTFQSIIFLYFIALYTNWGTWGDSGRYYGVGIHLSSQLFPIICPWVILLKNTFI